MSDPLVILSIIVGYLALLVILGVFTGRMFRGTSKDYFVASHSIGPFLLLMSVFGTTMTAFALVGSTGKSFERGIGVYGLMASSSGLIHAACFFMVGIRLWVYGKKYGYVTQIQYFRDRFESNGLGYLLFPILVGFVIPYLLIGVIGAGKTIQSATAGAFVDAFPHPMFPGGIPPWLTGIVICAVVLMYVFAGGSRSTAWANTFQTLVFMLMGVVAFVFITNSLGGIKNATNVAIQSTDDGRLVWTQKWDAKQGKMVKAPKPKTMGRIRPGGEHEKATKGLVPRQPHLQRTVTTGTFKKFNPIKKEFVMKDGKPVLWEREFGIPPLMFLTYMFIPLSVGMFPHLFQHWLTAKSARAFRLTLIAHPLCIVVVWVPCVLIGAWATGLVGAGVPPAAILANVVRILADNPVLTGLLTAGVLAAIMSSLDSQFLCMGTIFTNDIVLHRNKNYSDRQIILIARLFVVGVVTVTYILAMLSMNANVFDLAVWCFTGFSALTPIVFAALYWKRATKAGAFASVIGVLITWITLFTLASVENKAAGGEYTLPYGIMPVAVCFLVGSVAMVVVSLATKPPSQPTIDKFFPPDSALDVEQP